MAVWTGIQVTGIDADGVSIGPERIHARTVLWAAGVAASPVAQTLGVPLDQAGRVVVEPDLTIPGHADVYVIGDLARIDFDGALVPGVAPAAIQAGRHAARNVRRTLRAARRAVSLCRQRDAGHDRPRHGCRPDRSHQGIRNPRLAALALRSHLFPDRLSQPDSRPVPVGLVIHHLRPRRRG